jgi:hypothetical protein
MPVRTCNRSPPAVATTVTALPDRVHAEVSPDAHGPAQARPLKRDAATVLALRVACQTAGQRSDPRAEALHQDQRRAVSHAPPRRREPQPVRRRRAHLRGAGRRPALPPQAGVSEGGVDARVRGAAGIPPCAASSGVHFKLVILTAQPAYSRPVDHNMPKHATSSSPNCSY